jgi:hypothetical protein
MTKLLKKGAFQAPFLLIPSKAGSGETNPGGGDIFVMTLNFLPLMEMCPKRRKQQKGARLGSDTHILMKKFSLTLPIGQ